jgi:DNA-binding IclR family transcriptional regulator
MTTKQTSPASAAPDNIYATPALEKGLDVLELLARQLVGLTKSQIARELDRSVSEIFRTLVTLERRGYISQTEGDRYALTLKLFKLVQEHPPIERMVAVANSIMQRVAHESRQSCHLGVIERSRVIFLAQVNAPTSAGYFVKLGSTADLMETSTGHVILAYLDEARREQILADWCEENGKKLPDGLEEHLAAIRKEGFERRESYAINGIVNISFPVFDDQGFAAAAVTIPYVDHNNSRLTAEDVTAILAKGAADVTAAIGGIRPARSA